MSEKMDNETRREILYRTAADTRRLSQKACTISFQLNTLTCDLKELQAAVENLRGTADYLFRVLSEEIFSDETPKDDGGEQK